MKELRAIVAAAAHLKSANEEGVLVTLVRTEGSAYRRPGARMLVFPGGGTGRTVGLISGGCLESAVAKEAWQRTRETARAILTVDSGPDEETWGPSSGCHGKLTFLAERIERGTMLPAVEAMQRVFTTHRAETFVHNMLFEGSTIGTSDWSAEEGTVLASGRSTWAERGGCGAFIEFLGPVPHMVICGAGDDALPVAKFAAELGWRVSVRDSRGRLATRERFPMAEEVLIAPAGEAADDVHPHSMAVIMSHRFMDDVEYVGQMCGRGLGYVGILGPRERTKRLLNELNVRGQALTSQQMTHIFSPVGLDLGARTPEAIALSIVAEVQAYLSDRDGKRLSLQGAGLTTVAAASCGSEAT